MVHELSCSGTMFINAVITNIMHLFWNIVGTATLLSAHTIAFLLQITFPKNYSAHRL